MTRPLSTGTLKRSDRMASIFNRKGIIYVQYRVNERLVQKSTRMKDTEKNRAYIEKKVLPSLEKKILNGELNFEKVQSFSFYAKRYLDKKQSKKTHKKMCAYIEVLNQTFGRIRIDKITVSDIEDWIELRKNVNSIKTIQNYLSAMSGVFKEAIKKEDISLNKVLLVELDDHVPNEIEPFSSKEVGILLQSATGNLKRFIAIGFYTGLRTGEIMALEKSDIDLEKGEISVSKTITDGKLQSPKTKASVRKVPIFDELVPYLKNIEENGYIFSKKDNTHYSAFPGHYAREWEALLKTCSISYRKIYGTRHTFIVNMIRNSGMSILEIAQFAGHTTIQMIVKHYAKFIENEHMKVSRNLNLFTDKTADSAA